MGDENFDVGDRVLTKSLPVCSEQLMSPDVFHRDKAKVIKERRMRGSGFSGASTARTSYRRRGVFGRRRGESGL
jgi:hypothetical protein